ncbi:MAG TPA: hypothetical protein VGG24_19645, partial [Paraburkholderia sp.]
MALTSGLQVFRLRDRKPATAAYAAGQWLRIAAAQRIAPAHIAPDSPAADEWKHRTAAAERLLLGCKRARARG